MQLHLLAVGNRMPAWVAEGYREYAQRLPPSCALRLIELPAERRGKGRDLQRVVCGEGQRLLAAIPKGARTVVLDVQGREWSTEELAGRLDAWMHEGRDVALLVGGPEGLSEDCMRQADERWSLSRLTLPHPMVRIVLAEQIYRAWTLLNGHPYHRA